MYILAIDSTAKIASVALLSDEKALGSYHIDAGLTQSELLLPMAEHLLASLHLSFADIGLLAVSVGPGSFTGVRIGTALAKGLAFGRDIPCVEVSTLEALAENLRGFSGCVLPVMDARRAQVYTATFRADRGSMIRETPDRAMPVSALVSELAARGELVLPVGDGAEAVLTALAAAGVSALEIPSLLRDENAVSVGRVALRRYHDGATVSDRDLRPVYLRLPQAERERLEREAAAHSN